MILRKRKRNEFDKLTVENFVLDRIVDEYSEIRVESKKLNLTLVFMHTANIHQIWLFSSWLICN
jgi:hypothetical protein